MILFYPYTDWTSGVASRQPWPSKAGLVLINSWMGLPPPLGNTRTVAWVGKSKEHHKIWQWPITSVLLPQEPYGCSDQELSSTQMHLYFLVFITAALGRGTVLRGFHILFSVQVFLVFPFLLLVLPSDKTWHAQCSPYPSHAWRCGLAEDSGPVFLWRWVEAAIWTSRRRLVARSSKALERKRTFCALWFKLAPAFLAVPWSLVLKLQLLTKSWLQ